MMNFTFLKISPNTKKRTFNIFLFCFLLLSCVNKNYAKASFFATPKSGGVQAAPSLSNSFSFRVVEVRSTVNSEATSFVGIPDAVNIQNTFFYIITIILKQ
jgi:hypothetical protein